MVEEEFPEYPLVNFEVANGLDYANKDELAVPRYLESLELGPHWRDQYESKDTAGPLLQRRSKLSESIALLRETYHDRKALSIAAFLALYLHEVGRCGSAVSLLIRSILECCDNEDLNDYKRSMFDYVTEIE